jgi:hypothetical protein
MRDCCYSPAENRLRNVASGTKSLALNSDSGGLVQPEKVFERSVDSLSRIYAVIIALAIGQSISILLLDPSTRTLDLGRATVASLPVFVAFAVTVVPFYHGMNRHLDECYLVNKSTPHGALLLDFAVFFVEAALLFAISVSVRAGLQGFYLLATLLAVDTIWGTVSHLIHVKVLKKGALRWAMLNLATLLFGFFWLTWSGVTDTAKTAGLLILACSRTILDYGLNWTFYFPKDVDSNV